MKYDVIIIGGGHNGLVAAAYLAKAGRKVVVLEKRSVPGGAAATEKVFENCLIDTGAHDAGLFRPEIVKDLGLAEHGLEFVESSVAAFAPQPEGDPLFLWRDSEKNTAEIAVHSKKDAERFPAFVRQIHRFADVLSQVMLLPPPNPRERNFSELFQWLKPALKLKGLGERDMMEFLRFLPMTATEFLNEWFENDLLKGLLGAASVTGSLQGPQSGGTAFMLLYHYLGGENGGFRSSRFVRSGVGKLSEALTKAAGEFGAEIRFNAGAAEIKLAQGRAVGVVLENREEIQAETVVSSLDPRLTFFSLIGAPNLEVAFMRRVRNIRFKGSTAKINLVASELPAFKNAPSGEDHLRGHIIINPSLDYLERAYDDAKYGEISKHPMLDVTIPTLHSPEMAPENHHILSITMQFAPYHLREGDWKNSRDELLKITLDKLAEYAPNVKDSIVHQQVLTPLDWEQDYGLTEGSIFHGQMALDQMLFMRPVAGYGQYKTPIDGLFLCGSGAHPGGGLTGAPGRNAAKIILKSTAMLS